MRLFYADPGLVKGADESASTCQTLLEDCSQRGVETVCLASARVDVALQQSFSAIPFFTEWPVSDDPVSGWLEDFHAGTVATDRNLKRLNDASPSDAVYFRVIDPAHFGGLTHWLAALPARHRPRILVELAGGPGADIQKNGDKTVLSLPAPEEDSRAVLYRSLLPTLRPLGNVPLVTIDPHSAAVFSGLLGIEVGVLPSPSADNATFAAAVLLRLGLA